MLTSLQQFSKDVYLKNKKDFQLFEILRYTKSAHNIESEFFP